MQQQFLHVNLGYLWFSPALKHMISHTNWSLGHSLLICDQYTVIACRTGIIFLLFSGKHRQAQGTHERGQYFLPISITLMVLAKLHHFQCNLPFFMVGHHLTFATFSW